MDLRDATGWVGMGEKLGGEKDQAGGAIIKRLRGKELGTKRRSTKKKETSLCGWAHEKIRLEKEYGGASGTFVLGFQRLARRKRWAAEQKKKKTSRKPRKKRRNFGGG